MYEGTDYPLPIYCPDEFKVYQNYPLRDHMIHLELILLLQIVVHHGSVRRADGISKVESILILRLRIVATGVCVSTKPWTRGYKACAVKPAIIVSAGCAILKRLPKF